ncbi:MAG: hypothetical protein ABI947_18355 [Chloroflexota bacterium]
MNVASELTSDLMPTQQQSVKQQAVIGWLQTLLLVIVFVQVIFAGLLRALPPDVRVSLAFLHRIEWAAYIGIVLIVAQVIVGWSSAVVLTNRFYLLAWRFSKPRVLTGQSARIVQGCYLLLALAMVAAIVWVRIHGFIVTPTR